MSSTHSSWSGVYSGTDSGIEVLDGDPGSGGGGAPSGMEWLLWDDNKAKATWDDSKQRIPIPKNE